MANDDTCIPGFRASPRRCTARRPDLPAAFHDGRELMESQDGTLPVALAPSGVPNERFHVMPRAMPSTRCARWSLLRRGGAPHARRGLRRRRDRGVPRLPARAVPEPAPTCAPTSTAAIDGRLRFLRERSPRCATRSATRWPWGCASRWTSRPAGLTGARRSRLAGLGRRSGRLRPSRGHVGHAGRLGPHRAAECGRRGYTAPLAARARRSCRAGDGRRAHQPAAGRRAAAPAAHADACVMTRALICDPEMP